MGKVPISPCYHGGEYNAFYIKLEWSPGKYAPGHLIKFTGLISSRSKTIHTTISRYEILILNLDHIWGQGLLEDELGNPISRTDHKGLAGVEVLKNHLDLTLIIWVNDSGQSV